MYGPATEKIREAYMKFLRSCPLGVRIAGNVFVCHSLPEGVDRGGFDAEIFRRPLDAVDLKEHGQVFKLLWGRDHRSENAQAFAKKIEADVLIHGHEPCPEGYNVPNECQIILDCCNENGTYLILPTGGTLNHDQIVQRIQRLNG
jgi:hypothetical protein